MLSEREADPLTSSGYRQSLSKFTAQYLRTSPEGQLQTISETSKTITNTIADVMRSYLHLNISLKFMRLQLEVKYGLQ